LFCLVIILTVFLLSIPQNVAAQGFPIGLHLEYKLESYSNYGTSSSSTKIYEFIQWTDDSKTRVEIEIDSVASTIGYPSGEIDVATDVPLWVDVSSWSTGSMTFKGRTYEVTTGGNNGHHCWHLHSNPSDGVYYNYWYHHTSGFLVVYGRSTWSDFSVSGFRVILEEDNLGSFIFLGGFGSPLVTVLLFTGIFIELVVICRFWDRRTGKR